MSERYSSGGGIIPYIYIIMEMPVRRDVSKRDKRLALLLTDITNDKKGGQIA